MFISPKLTFVFGAALLALGCGGRAAHPVDIIQPNDDRLSCAHLAGEHANNEKRLLELREESGAKPAYNAGMLISSPLLLDFSDTQREEAAALIARNERLESLMAVACKPGEDASTQ